MSGGRSDDLSGDWAGIFSYPDTLPATAFAARLADAAGVISGVIEEPDIFAAATPAIGAMVDGRREGASVRFVKFYDDAAAGPDSGYDIVHYEGVIADGGDEITGRWDIPGAWSGTFIMTRLPGADAPAAEIVAEEVPR